MDLLDKIEGFDYFRQIFARDIHSRARAQAQAKEDRVEVLFDFLHGNVLAHLDPAPNFDAQGLNHADLLEAHLGRHFVISDAISVESARLCFLFEDHSLMP